MTYRGLMTKNKWYGIADVYKTPARTSVLIPYIFPKPMGLQNKTGGAFWGLGACMVPHIHTHKYIYLPQFGARVPCSRVVPVLT